MATPYTNLELLPAPVYQGKLETTKNALEVVRHLRNDYALTIVDSAPILSANRHMIDPIALASEADRFTLKRSLHIKPDYPVAVTTSPVDTITLKSLVTTPNHFFTDRLALSSWRHFAETNPGLAKYNFNDKNTMLAAIEALSLTLDKESQLQLDYFGPDPELGIQLINYYMNRLLSRLRAGYHRQQANVIKTKNFNHPGQLQLDKTELTRTKHKAWWRNERLGPAAVVTLLPFVAALIIIGFREFLDPSFKSGRQAARYLNLPILGFIPPLDPIINNLQEGKNNTGNP